VRRPARQKAVGVARLEQNREAVRFDFTKVLRDQSTTTSNYDKFTETSWKPTYACAYNRDKSARIERKLQANSAGAEPSAQNEQRNAFRIEAVCKLALAARHFRLERRHNAGGDWRNHVLILFFLCSSVGLSSCYDRA
jgi:hypothetical protein